MLKIVKFPDPILRVKTQEFNFNNPIIDPKILEKDLIEAMLKFDGIGLAANQVGINARVFAMGWKETPDSAKAFFNPTITAHTEDIEDLEEGCLSFPGIFVKIKRPAKIRARWQNSNGEFETGEFEGYNCKCFLHEYDHLEGIVFKDRVSNLKWQQAVKKGIKNNVRTK